MTLPTLTQAFGQQGSADSPIYYWPENSEVVASAARFNEINQALYGFIKQLEAETGISLGALSLSMSAAQQAIIENVAGIQACYTKLDMDGKVAALQAAINSAQATIDGLNALYQTDDEAAQALSALSAQWNATSEDFKTTVTGWLNQRYTKLEVDALLDQKVPKGTVYTRAETDDLLSGKASASHNHTLRIGDGSFERMTLGTQERLDFKAGNSISIEFDDNLNALTFSAGISQEMAIFEVDGGTF